MANKFVWSGAGGANDGSSWDNAYTSLMRDWGAEGTFTPGTDKVYVRSVHAESTAASKTITGSTAEGTTDRVQVLSVVGAATGTTPGALAVGASVTSTGTNDCDIDEGIYIYGVSFIAGNDIDIGTGSLDDDITLEQCRLETTNNSSASTIDIGTTTGAGQRFHFIDCDLDYNHVGSGLILNAGFFVWDGGTLDFLVDDFVLNGARGSVFVFRNMDLSILTSNLFAGAATGIPIRVVFERCLLGSGCTINDQTIDTPGTFVEAYQCQIGTDADPGYQMEIHSERGNVSVDTASFRTSGSSDDERTNPISWDMDTTTGSKRSYPGHALQSPPIAGWTTGDGATAVVFRIYIASGGTQQDDDVWFDLVGPNDAATNSLGVRKTTRVAPEGTPANLTTDGTSTWTGADVGTKQYMEITYTPDKPGPIHAIVHMATDAGATGHIFIDPKIYIDP